MSIDTTRRHIMPETLDGQVPACMLWQIPSKRVMRVPLSDPKTYSPRLYAWQRGRCALCGIRDDLVLDHSHISGLVRGLVCGICNRLEGTSDGDRFARWRSGWNPATLLGIEEQYISPITGEPVLSPYGEYLRMSPEERQRHHAHLRAVIDAMCALMLLGLAGAPWLADLLLVAS